MHSTVDSPSIFLYLMSGCAHCERLKQSGNLIKLDDVCATHDMQLFQCDDEPPPQEVLTKLNRPGFPLLYVYYEGHLIEVPHRVLYRSLASVIGVFKVVKDLLIEASQQQRKRPNSSSIASRRTIK